MEFRIAQVSHAVDGGKQFFVTNAALLPRTIASGARRQLDTLGDQIRNDGIVQDMKALALHGEVARKAALKEVLFREHLGPVVAAAQLLGQTVTVLQSVKLPKESRGAAPIVAAAYSIAGTVAPYANELVVLGLAPDFVYQLQVAAGAFEAASVATRGHRGGRKKATAALWKWKLAATKVFRALDKMVRAELPKGHEALVEWASVKRILNRSVSTAVDGSTAAVTKEAVEQNA